MKKVNNTVNVYGCGGTGIDVLTNYLDVPVSLVGFAEAKYVGIDTSDSNVKDTKNEVNWEIIAGVEGSGFNKSFAFDQTKDHLDKILQRNQPGDFNIVVFSLAGGTGSTVGPQLIHRLLQRGKPVVALCVSSTTSQKEASNTLATITTLQKLATKTSKKPVVMTTYSTSDMSLADIDEAIANDIRALMVLMSGNNDGLDNTDLANFLNPIGVVPGLLPQVLDLEIVENPTDAVPVIACASLLTQDNPQKPEIKQLYGCSGFMSPAMVESSNQMTKTVHFLLTNADVNDRYHYVLEQTNAFSDHRKEVESIVPFIPEDDGENFL